jgi:hypothetical protein
VIYLVRFSYENLIGAAGSSLTPSSQQSSLPAAWVYDQLRSQTWRSKSGFNVVASMNDRLDFLDGANAKVADLTVGNYATPDLFASHIQARMNAQAGLANTYAVTYDSIAAKFTVTRATGASAVELPWSSGTNTTRTVGTDLGFDTSANDTGATSYIADARSYHGREWLTIDLGSAQPAMFAAALDHNAAFGTITLQLNSSDDWTSPAFTQVLSGDEEKRLAWFSQQTYRYARFLFDDVQNPDGYTSAGIVWLGTYFEPARGVDIEFMDGREELGRYVQADRGAHFRDVRPRRIQIEARFSLLEQADRDAFDSMAQVVGIGGNLFFGLDVAVNPDAVLYGFFEDALSGEYRRIRARDDEGDRYGVPFRFKEALG